jgi:hypothetical protein
LQSVACISRPLEGVPASLGPGLRTVSGAVRSLGEKLSPIAVCPMTGESTNSQKTLLDQPVDEVANNRQDAATGPWPIPDFRQKHAKKSGYAHNARSSEYSSVMT